MDGCDNTSIHNAEFVLRELRPLFWNSAGCTATNIGVAVWSMSSGRLARFFGLIPTPMREYTCVPQVAGKLSEVASSSDIIEILRERGPRSEPVAST